MCDRSNSSSDSDYDEKKNKVNKRSSSSVASVTSATYPAKKTKSWYQQSFNNNWLQDPELKDWIEADSKDRFVVRCKVCDFSLSNINKSSLLAHKMTQKHVKNFEFKKDMTNIKTFFVTPKTPSLREQVAKAELLHVEFWFKLSNDHMKFGLLSNFMCGLMALPHSSACVERIFSQVNMVKTAQTNKLHAETVASRLLAKQAIARDGVDCHAWTPSKSLVADVAEGRCHQRYSERQKLTKMQVSTTLVTLPPSEEEDVYDVIGVLK